MTTTTTRNGNLEITADFSKPLKALRQEPTKHGKKVIIAKASSEDQDPALTEKEKSNIQQLWEVMPEADRIAFLKEKFVDNRVNEILREIGFNGLQLK